MRQTQSVQLFGQREYDVKIGGIEQVFFLPQNPFFTFESLTIAVSIATGIVGNFVITTVDTAVQMSTQLCRSAFTELVEVIQVETIESGRFFDGKPIIADNLVDRKLPFHRFFLAWSNKPFIGEYAPNLGKLPTMWT